MVPTPSPAIILAEKLAVRLARPFDDHSAFGNNVSGRLVLARAVGGENFIK